MFVGKVRGEQLEVRKLLPQVDRGTRIIVSNSSTSTVGE